MAGSELTRSFHNLDPRYENVRSPLLVVFCLGWMSLCDLVSYVVLLSWNRSWRHSAFIWWNDLYVSIINNFSLYKSKEEDPFLWSSSSYVNSNVSWSMRSDRSWIFSNFWLFVFPQNCHTKGQYSKLFLMKLMKVIFFRFYIKIFRNSGQCIKLSGSFEAAGTYVVIKRQLVIYSDAKSFNRSFRAENCIPVQFQFNVICGIRRQNHELEFVWIGFHAVFFKPINSNFTINA